MSDEAVGAAGGRRDGGSMPLSQHELTVLAAIEEGLRDEDPALAAALDGGSSSPSDSVPTVRIRDVLALLAVVTTLAGSALLPPGWLTAVAFALLFAGLAALPRLVVGAVERYERSSRSSRTRTSERRRP